MAQSKSDKSKEADLKAREYRDAKGQIHHHTHTYMESHRQDGDRGDDRGGDQGGGASKEARRASSGKADGRDRSGGAQTTTDHDEIRTWAESHGGRPAAVKSTHRDGDVGIIRIMFPEAPNSDHDALQEISWDEFFEEFESRDLALLYEDDSMFSKIIGRDTARKRQGGDNHARR